MLSLPLTSAEKVRDKVITLFRTKLGSASNTAGESRPALFLGQPNYDYWKFTGVLCIINPVSTSTPNHLIGGKYENFDWLVEFVQYSYRGNETALRDISNILKNEFADLSLTYQAYDQRAGILERLIANIGYRALKVG